MPAFFIFICVPNINSDHILVFYSYVLKELFDTNHLYLDVQTALEGAIFIAQKGLIMSYLVFRESYKLKPVFIIIYKS
jgi:hypothetical protein